MNVKLENSLVCGVIFLFVCTMRCEHNRRSALRQGPLPREERPRGVGGFAQGEEPQCSQRPFTCHGLLAMRHAPCPPILVPVLVEPGKCNLKIAIFGAPITSGAGGGVMAQPPKPPPWESKCPTSQTAHSTPGEETAQTKIIHDIKKDHQISTNKKKPTSLSLVKLSHCPDCPTTAPRFLTIKKSFFLASSLCSLSQRGGLLTADGAVTRSPFGSWRQSSTSPASDTFTMVAHGTSAGCTAVGPPPLG